MAKQKKPVKRNAVAQKDMRANSLQNKITKLGNLVRKNPKDISADIALSQAKYDLATGQY